MLQVKKIAKKNKIFIVNDHGKSIKIKQPKLSELESLYFVLLENLMKVNLRSDLSSSKKISSDLLNITN